MSRRSWIAAILAAAMLALGLLLPERDGSDKPADRATRQEESGPRDALPTLLSREPETSPALTPVPPAPPEPASALRLRVTGDGMPVPEAAISLQHVGPGSEEELPGPITTDQDGRAAVPLEESMFPVAIVVRGPVRYVPKAITLDERPDDEILVDLEAGQALTVRTIDMDRKPLAGIPVIVYAIGHWARGNSGMTQAPSGWLLEDSRRATTGADGTVVVDGLDPSRLYRAHAPGYGVPAQIVPPPEIPQPKHDAVAPGPESTVVLMLAALRTVWARAVDAGTGEPVSMPWFRPFFAPERRPKEQDVLMRAVHPETACGVLGLSERIRSGDYFRMYVMGKAGSEAIAVGPFKVDAPGYKTTEVLLQARAVGDLARKPMEVRLERKPDTVFAPLTISLRTNRARVRAIVQLRQARRTLLHRGFDAESRDRDIEMQVALGTYELFVGGTSMGSVEVRGPEPIRRTVNLDELPSLQISLSVGGTAYTGIGSVAMAGPGATRWMFVHFRIPYRGGLSPHVIVPAGELTVAAGTGDGRYLKDYEHPSIAPGEKATIEVRLP